MDPEEEELPPQPPSAVPAATQAANNSIREMARLIRLPARRSLHANGKSRMPQSAGGSLRPLGPSRSSIVVVAGTWMLSIIADRTVFAGKDHEVLVS